MSKKFIFANEGGNQNMFEVFVQFILPCYLHLLFSCDENIVVVFYYNVIYFMSSH